MPDARDPYDWEAYPDAMALGRLAAKSSPVIHGALVHRDEAARRFAVIVTRWETRSLLELLEALPGAEAAARRWQRLPDGWTVLVVLDGRQVSPGGPWKRGETWEGRERDELRKHAAGGVVHLVAPGLVGSVRPRRDARRRELVVEVAWEDELTAEQAGGLRASLEFWLALWVWDGWTARVVVAGA